MPAPKFVEDVRQWTLNSISIRLRLALWYGTLLFLTLTLFSIVVFAVAEIQLESSVDQNLQGRAQLLAQTIQGELRRDGAVGGTGVPTLSPPAATATNKPVPSITATPGAAVQVTPTSAATPAPTVDPAQQNTIQKQLQLNKSAQDLLGRIDLTFEVLNANGTIVYEAQNIRPTGLPPNQGGYQHSIADRHLQCIRCDAGEDQLTTARLCIPGHQSVQHQPWLHDHPLSRQSVHGRDRGSGTGRGTGGENRRRCEWIA